MLDFEPKRDLIDLEAFGIDYQDLSIGVTPDGDAAIGAGDLVIVLRDIDPQSVEPSWFVF